MGTGSAGNGRRAKGGAKGSGEWTGKTKDNPRTRAGRCHVVRQGGGPAGSGGERDKERERESGSEKQMRQEARKGTCMGKETGNNGTRKPREPPESDSIWQPTRKVDIKVERSGNKKRK